MFDKILIANRGEIAVRVLKTARRMGIRTVAVYSDADANAMHVQLADEAVCIGAAPAAQSYLSVEKILDAARRTGAQGIHPGYGFLSENAAFAKGCADAGIVFIGPPIEAIRVMGSKAESKRLMSGAGVPLVPGYHGEQQDMETLRAAADKIGYPVLVKASAGGGGKGMRIVRDSRELTEAVTGARRESKAAFGDDRLLLEKYLVRPRHVEIQVFADQHGNCVYLFERDCSLQRRHQKVIEEAPAPKLDDALRIRMGEAAVAAARAVNYVGAGTVEFLYEDGSFYFIEMNTRLQVEHPVTEMITGLDLVEWQLRVASNEPLPLSQQQLVKRGHAFEARLYAEDPRRGFLPAIGKLQHLQPPLAGPHVRVDTGVCSGDEISVYYDPMIAKLIVWDEDRPAALRRLRRALAEYQVVGVTTNIEFLSQIAAHPAFAQAEIDTGFIERHGNDLTPAHAQAPAAALVIAAIASLESDRDDYAPAARGSQSRDSSPWDARDGWRMNALHQQTIKLKQDQTWHELTLQFQDGGYQALLPEARIMTVSAVARDGNALSATLDDHRIRATVLSTPRGVSVILDGETWRLEFEDPFVSGADHHENPGHLTAPMPGVVVAVLVEPDQQVVKDQPLMVLEAMKMEHTIRSPHAGRVKALNYAVGQKVTDGAELLEIEAAVEQ